MAFLEHSTYFTHGYQGEIEPGDVCTARLCCMVFGYRALHGASWSGFIQIKNHLMEPYVLL